MISQTLFVKTIEALREQYNHDKECADKLSEMFGGIQIPGSYNTSYLSNAILDLLRVHFPMSGGECEIEFYAYCQNFGKPSPDAEYESPEQLYRRLLNDLIS